MTIPLTSSSGFFTRLGHEVGALLDNNAYQGGAATTNVLAAAALTARYTQWQEDFATGTPVTQLLDGIYAQYVVAGQGAINSLNDAIKKISQGLLIQMANNDVTLPSPTVAAAMQVLVNQMTGPTFTSPVATVQGSTPAAGSQTAAVGQTPVGNPTILASVTNGKGTLQQYMLAETILFTCTNDVYNGATANQQPFSAVCPAVESNPLAYTWPQGSGSSITLNCVDSLQNNAAGNILQNSDFDTFTNGVASSPDNWVRVLGSATWGAGGQANSYATSVNCLAMTSDGATLSSITQTFETTTSTSADAGGTPGTIEEDTVYGVNFYVKMSAMPSAGVMKVDLIDGSGNILNDDNGVANTITKTLTAVSTAYVNVSGTFRTPLNLPTTVKIRIRVSTAIDSGKILYIDHLAMTAMTPLYGGQVPYYGGGPLFSVFSGDTQPRIGDAWTIATTMTFGVFQKAMQRLFGMTGLGLQLPYTSGSPTVSDALVE